MPLLPILLAAAVAIAAPPDGAAASDEGVPIAGTWRLLQRMPLVEGPVCLARTTGPDVNTSLTINNVGVPVLITARAGWSHNGRVTATVSIDGEAPRPVEAEAVINLVMVLLPDQALLQRLRRARTLDWTFPFGKYRAGVADLGTALDALTACERRRAKAA
jgi:hypothetical protein